jgi:hypothetical protein
MDSEKGRRFVFKQLPLSFTFRADWIGVILVVPGKHQQPFNESSTNS